jgi:uncharacterized transporter YbjL
MAAKEEIRFSIIDELTAHIEKLEMDNEIHILRDDFNQLSPDNIAVVEYEKERDFILKLKNILGKLIEDKKLSEDEIKVLSSVIKNKNIIGELVK